ncbi:UNVERIFIED_CONTAM: hypothetical protein RF648_18745 [Kocuria sp. CPCC 205274]|uniref:Uncharacterized protein n=1 Tax=Herbiconiux daphne TaxID=2970914 RepID=A0ABT2HAK2_9MICO|nr:hypothetical protein [Herbiconiux daphne]MCS5736922.1 hypothetical protein [Herbiconiux daphne]
MLNDEARLSRIAQLDREIDEAREVIHNNVKEIISLETQEEHDNRINSILANWVHTEE